ncbi:GAF domain-containing protein [Streptacidiphilus rugosus]|uniref:GAF domain-containing protein n=1 Tax=Streptacidiphilus rugosus TaxID=405783 RepID=UPI0006917A4B|nr:GAF domain-containing protein [Streptacidiphilus rugosus]
MSRAELDEILRSTVRLARLSFAAAAASVFVRDVEHGTLVFEASSGVGEDRLVGVTIPGDHGIAGWVANTGEPMIVKGVAEDSRFDRGFAESTGLVPDVIMAVPMEHAGEILGVLEVLDPTVVGIGDLDAMDLLTELANQSASVLALSLASRGSGTGGAGPSSAAGEAALGRIAAAAAAAAGPRADQVTALLSAVADLLDAER